MSTPEESKGNEGAKEALEKSRDKNLRETPSYVDPSGAKQTKPTPKPKGKDIAESKDVFDSAKSMFEAVTGTGRFEGDSDGLFARISKAFGKADNVTKLLTGAGIMAAVMKVFGDLSDGDSKGSSPTKSIKNSYKNVSGNLNKNKQASETLVSRIEHAMQQQNKENNLVGYGVAMKSLAMISIKTQEGLSNISDFIYKSNLTLVSSINSLKDTIDEINSNNGDVFQGLFPLLIGGIITAFGAFFLGSGGTDGIMDKLVQKVVLEIRKDLKIDGEKDKNKSIINTVLDKFIDDIKEKFNLNLGLFEDFSNTELYKELKKLFNDEEFSKNVSDLLKAVSNSKNIQNFFDNIKKISEHTDSIQNSLREFKDILEGLPILKDFIDKSVDNNDANNTKENKDKSNASWLDKTIAWGGEQIDNITKKVSGLQSISETLKEMVKNIKPISELLSKVLNKEERNKFFKEVLSDLTSSIKEAFKNISSGFVDGISTAISELDAKINDFLNGNKALRNYFNEFLVELLKNEDVSTAIKRTTAAKINEIGVSANIKTINMAKEAGIIDANNIPQGKAIELSTPQTESESETKSKTDSSEEELVTVSVSDLKEIQKDVKVIEALVSAGFASVNSNTQKLGESLTQTVVASAQPINNQNTFEKKNPSRGDFLNKTIVT